MCGCESIYVWKFWMPGSGVLLTKLNAVPPEYATLTARPRSRTENVNDSVPGVWPGVAHIVTVVSPRVIFMPSVATMSRLGAMVLYRFG